MDLDDRTCSVCEEVKPAKDFYFISKRTGKLRPECRVCTLAAQKARRKPGYATERYYRDVEKARADGRKFYAKHRETRMARVREWQEAHPEKVREIKRKAQQKRRALLVGVFVDDVDPLVVLERDGPGCGICGEDTEPGFFSLDHIVPLARGGEHSYANVQIAHRSCNSRKHTKLPEEMAVAA